METLDSIKIRDIEVQVYQSKAGYRFSLDALLLADFPAVRTCARILELGAGLFGCFWVRFCYTIF